jgi:hypothetical protein
MFGIFKFFFKNTPQKISILWSYPRLYDSVINSKDLILSNRGIYQITTKNLQGDALIYVGKSYDSFKSRIHKHSTFLKKYSGIKFISFGILTEPNSTSKSQLKHFINDVEKAIIFETQPIHNIQAMQSYSTRKNRDYHISNFGYTGFIPEFINTQNH